MCTTRQGLTSMHSSQDRRVPLLSRSPNAIIRLGAVSYSLSIKDPFDEERPSSRDPFKEGRPKSRLPGNMSGKICKGAEEKERGECKMHKFLGAMGNLNLGRSAECMLQKIVSNTVPGRRLS
eukprot:1158863-Pelagomonas_calceolata.AAC.3